jgi:hypothetical protein
MGHRRGAASAAVTAVVFALALTGCGGGGGGGGAKGDGKPAGSTSASHGAGATGSDSTPSDEPAKVIAQLKGEAGMVVTINSAVRDSGGYVTVKGEITNNGDEPFSATDWMGEEVALQASGDSVAGASLIDEAGKKRYYVLRDTGGMCLCTMGLTGIEPKETRPFFAQFPSPPPTTTQVEFELPTMPPAKITISEG